MTKNALAERAAAPNTAAKDAFESGEHDNVRQFPATGKKDYFIERDGVRFAGMHLLVEMWNARGLDDPDLIKKTLCDSALAADATILHAHMHRFSPYGGVSGVVVLAESHISIHTWPERGYAAIDIFMCGKCDPHKAIPVLRATFQPGSLQVSEHKRGLIP